MTDDAREKAIQRLWQIRRTAYSRMFTEPDTALQLFREGVKLAQVIQHPYWYSCMMHWQLQTLIYAKDAYNEAYELAIEATVEVRKPAYAPYQYRICIHEDLIAIYLGIDPAGYADLIQQAIDYMQEQITGDLQCRYCLQNRRTTFHKSLQQREEWREATQQYLAMSEGYTYHHVVAHLDLCLIDMVEERWQDLLDHVQYAIALCRDDDDHIQHRVTFLALQALALHKLDREQAAHTAYQQATTMQSRLGSTLSNAYCDALAAYHEHAGDLQAALRVRERELADIADKGQPFHECQTRLKLCELRQQLGLPLADDLERLRQVASKLVYQDAVLREIDALS